MFQDGPSQDRFSRFAQKIGSQFPVQTPMKVLEFGFRADGTPVDQTEKELGYRLANASGTRVVQITESGIALATFLLTRSGNNSKVRRVLCGLCLRKNAPLRR